jgi:hypothetical protein
MGFVVDGVVPAARGVRGHVLGEDLRDRGRVVVGRDLGVAGHAGSVSGGGTLVGGQALVRPMYVLGQQLLAALGVASAQRCSDLAVFGH